jgi:hypothetical protein
MRRGKRAGMKKRGTPIFKDNLTPQQRERQQAVFAKERRQEEKNRKTGEILDAAAAVLKILTDV